MLHTTLKVTTYRKSIYAALSAILLLTTASCVSTTAAQTSTMKATNYCQGHNQTPAYKNQSSQQRAMSCMLADLKNYQQKNMSIYQQYFSYKAQAWLDYAMHKENMNNHSPAGLKAAQTAESILQALKNGTEQELTLIQDIPSSSALMRPDLWATLSALKDNGGIASAPREIAFSEVALIWAATEQCEHGEQQSGSYFRIADRWLEQAREAYVNTHDSEKNVVLQALIVRYYKLYASLDSVNDTCTGQTLPTIVNAK